MNNPTRSICFFIRGIPHLSLLNTVWRASSCHLNSPSHPDVKGFLLHILWCETTQCHPRISKSNLAMGSHFCRCAARCYAHLQNLIYSVSWLWKIKLFFLCVICSDCFAEVTKLISFQVVLGTKSLKERWGHLQLWFLCARLARIFSCFVCPHLYPHNRFSLFFFRLFLMCINTLTSVMSCSLPSLKLLSTQPWVRLDIHNHVLSMYSCTYVTVVSQVCASVHRRVHSLSTDTPLSFHPDTPVRWIVARWWIPDKSIPCQCFHCRKWIRLLFQKAFYQMPCGCERRQKSSLKLHHERNIGSEGAEEGNKRERNGVNHVASVCVSGYQVSYLTPQAGTDGRTQCLSFCLWIRLAKILSFSFFMPLMLLLSLLPLLSLALIFFNYYKRCTSALLHETSSGTDIYQDMHYFIQLEHYIYLIKLFGLWLKLSRILIFWVNAELLNVKFTMTRTAKSYMLRYLSRSIFEMIFTASAFFFYHSYKIRESE